MPTFNVWFKKISSCENNPQISSSAKIDKHFPCGYLLSTIWKFDHIENKNSLYHGKDCILKEHAINIINLEEKKMLSLTPKESKSYEDADKCCI